jgi:hypothetical protein
MIPEFDSNGNLPPGIHAATLAQIRQRYANTPLRKYLFNGLVNLAKSLKASGCRTLYVDAVWEHEGVDNTIDPLLRKGWDLKAIKRKYGGDVFCRMPELLDVDHVEFFQTDRMGQSKGIIKIDLRKRL